MADAKLLVFGDSIAEGLGARGMGYTRILQQRLGYDVIDYSRSGNTVQDSLEAFRASPTSGDVAIVAHGITEPIIRPLDANLRWAPARWRRRGWMDPRAYYSTSQRRRVLEKAESATRWRAKNFAIRFGSWQLMTLHDYVATQDALLSALSQRRIAVVHLEPTHIDERFFPGSDEAELSYWKALSALVPLPTRTRDKLAAWDDYLLDHFHPNQRGHEKLAEIVHDAAAGVLHASP